MNAIVTLLTDFGSHDPFVGVMKGIILGIAPGAVMVDLCHHVPPFDIRRGALRLEESYRAFPEGTVDLAVVDPGVGTARRALALQAGGHLFVAPDNGLLSAPWQGHGDAYAVEITARRYFREPLSATFHGRDIFAPAAAHLALGLPPGELGPRVDRIALMTPLRSFLRQDVEEGCGFESTQAQLANLAGEEA